MEDVIRAVTNRPGGLQPGWLLQCAIRLLAILTELGTEAQTNGEALEQCIYRRAAEAK